MKLTTSRKAYLGVFALALAALAVDRFVLGGGGSGPDRAAASVVSGTATVEMEEAILPTTAAPPKRESLADRLEALAVGQEANAEAMRDVFRPCESWLLRPRTGSPHSPSPAEVFVQQHRLESVLLSGSAGYAIVDGGLLRIGETIAGYTLVELVPQGAVFQAEGSRFRVDLYPDSKP